MKKLIYIFIYALLLIAVKANAQNCACLETQTSPNWINERCDNFNNYDWNRSLSSQSIHWKKWDQNSGDAKVIFESHSPNGLYTHFENIAGQNSPDLLLLLGNKSQDRYRLSWRMKRASGHSAYYNIQHNQNGGSGSGGHWAYEIFIDANGNGELKNQGQGIAKTFHFPHEKWIDIVQIINPHGNVELWIDHKFIHSWPFKYGYKNTTNIYSNILGAINFYARSNDSYWIDDICLWYIDPNFFVVCPQNIDPVCVNDQEFDNDCYASIWGYTQNEWRRGICNSVACECEAYIHGEKLICDGFENYANGSLSLQSNHWTKFASNSSDAQVTSSTSYKGHQSLRLKNTTTSRGSDIVLDLDGKSHGKYRLEWMKYVPTNRTALLGILYNYTGNPNTNDWANRCYFNANSTGDIYLGARSTQSIKRFTYPQNRWFRVVYLIDLDNDEIELWIDNKFIHQWKYSAGQPTNGNQLDAVNYWATSSGMEYYIDAICYTRVSCYSPVIITCDPNHKQEVCVNGTEYTNPCIAQCAGYSAYEWTEGKCHENPPRKCDECTTCFSYWLEDDHTVHFTNNYCENHVLDDQGVESAITYNWDFPTGCILRYENGTNKNSYEPICKFNPGLWKVCLTITIPGGEVPITYYCCVYINIPRETCHQRPPTCGMTYNRNSDGTYTFDASNTTGADHYSWSVEGSYGSISSALDLDQNTMTYNCPSWGNGCYVICVTASNCYGYSRFCVEVCVNDDNCHKELPPTCGTIDYTINDDEISFNNVPSGWDSYEWSVPSNFVFRSGSSTSRTWTCGITDYGRYEVCLILQSGCSHICYCWTIGYGPTKSNIELYLDQDICGSPGQIVEVPIRVKNFNDILSIDASIEVENSNIAEIVSGEGRNLGGTQSTTNINNGELIYSWFPQSGNPISLADGTIIGIVKVRLKGQSGQSTKLRITSAELDVNGKIIQPLLGDGSVCINSSQSICGYITREDNIGVAKVIVGLTGNGISVQTETDHTGYYCFDNVPSGGRYIINPYKNINVDNGVKSSDAGSVQRHILRKKLLDSPYKIIAGDVNNNQSVKSSDASKIQQLVLRKISEFQGNTSWRFVPQSYSFPNPSNPFTSIFPETITIGNLSNNIADANFTGIKIGDVNLTNDPTNMEDKNGIWSRSQINLNLFIDNIEANTNQEKSLRVRATQFDDISSLQFSVEWDPNSLEFKTLDLENTHIAINEGNFNLDYIKDGKILFAWFDASGEGISRADTTMIFEFIFKTKDKVNVSSEIKFVNDPIDIDAEDVNGNVLNVITTNGGILTVLLNANDNINGFVDVSIFPNPVDQFITISIPTWEIEKTHLILYNQLGDQIKQSTIKVYNKSFIYDVSNIPDGVYYIHLSNNQQKAIQKIVVLH